MLSINSALFIHLFIFLVVVLFCAPLLIKPTMALLEERNSHIAGARDKARSLQEESDARLHEIEAKLTEYRRKALTEREKIRIEHVKKADALVSQARQEAQSQIVAMRERIAKERESARQTLLAEAEALSKDIARRVLGREVA